MRALLIIMTISMVAVLHQSVAQVSGPRYGSDSLQKETPLRSYGLFAVAGGAALPLGAMTERDVSNPESGFAKVGYTVQFLEASHYVTKYVGWGVRWNRHEFAMDHTAIGQWYAERLPGLEFFARSEDPWSIHAALGHVVGVLPTRLVDFDVRVGMGYASVYRPSVLIEGYDRVTGFFSFSRQQFEERASTLVYGVGSNIRWHIDQDIDLIVSWDYQWMQARLSVDHIYARSFEETITWEQSISLMTVTVGAGIRL